MSGKGKPWFGHGRFKTGDCNLTEEEVIEEFGDLDGDERH